MERLLRKVVLRKGVIEIMKKAYVKPELYFENFELSTSIAAGCEQLINNSTRGSCALILANGRNVFLDTVADCTTKQADGVNGYACYHVPVTTNNLFNSQ